MTLATYRLSEHLASFEFFYWLVMVQADGASKIVFDISNPKTRKLPDAPRRFHTIVEPGPALAGLGHRRGDDVGTLNARASQMIPWVRSGRTFRRLRSVLPLVRCDYTVTLRRNPGAKSRNSDEISWREFARRINAVVIEDYYVQPIHLHDRVALYAGARMNYGVCNGPMALCSLTEYPTTIMVNSESARNSNVRWGLCPGESYPWMLPGQRMIWRDDGVESLLRTHEEVTAR